MANRWGNYGNSEKLIFLGSKIIEDSDCSHKIKRHLLLGRKAMTNLNSILKSRDITLPTKVCLLKGMVFPVITYGYESWTIKKAEHWRIDALELWCCKTLDSSLDCTEIKPVNLKGFIGRTDAEAEAPILWPPNAKNWLIGKDPDAGKEKIEDRKRRGQWRMRWLDGIIDSMDMCLSKLLEMMKDWQVWSTAAHGFANSRTRLRDWTTKDTCATFSLSIHLLMDT